MTDPDLRPPRENLERAVFPGIELRAAEADGGMPTMVGHFAVFDQWAEINSVFEGRFMERIAPGAFKKTFAENRGAMKVTFNHGSDPSLGDQVLGPISVLEEDTRGARYEVPLLDGIPPLVVSGLRAGVYGSSFRFHVVKDEPAQWWKTKGEVSATNPEGLPERTIKEASVHEFGPVTYPAYPGASAGMRSTTDRYVMEQFTRDPERLAALLTSMHAKRDAIDKLSKGEPLLAQEAELFEAAIEHLEPLDETHSRTEPVTATPPAASRTPRFRSIQEFDQWLTSQVSAS